MLNLDPHILVSMLEDERRRTADLERQLVAARAGEVRWEHEAKALRKEIQRLRQDHDTEAISRKR